MLWPKWSIMDQGCHIAGASGQGCELFRGDVRNAKSMKLLPWEHDLVSVMSPPCPPWCRSSLKNGIEHEDGKLFIEAFAKMRYLQPLAVAIENVDSICDHQHFPILLQMLRWAGFKIIWQKITDLRSVAPIHRRRWLAVCTPVGDETCANPLVDLIWMPPTNLAKFGVFVELPESHIAELATCRSRFLPFQRITMFGMFWKSSSKPSNLIFGVCNKIRGKKF